jgi:circadian clock protein KaiC
MLGLQFIVAGVERYGQPGVVVTFEEAPNDLKQNVASLTWDLDKLVEAGKLAFVDVSPEPGEEIIQSGSFDLVALMARIEYAVNRIGAKRVVLDAIGSIFPQFSDSTQVRRELHRIANGLRRLGVTSVLSIERAEEYGPIARFGVEEFVADNVVILRNQLEQERRRRTIEILKVRGSSHRKGEYPYTISHPNGITIVPLSSITLNQPSSEQRISSGNVELDKMCDGGMFQNSIILVSGATGTGKTLMVTEFMKAAIERQERALMFAFEESREQLYRNAASWGVGFEQAEREGRLKVICRYPETLGLEDHLIVMKQEIEAFRPNRIAVDSMSALERGATIKSFREFVIGITGHVKAQGIAGMFTNTTSMLLGGESITETHISTITDSIILLRYVELFGEMRRGLVVLKMRGSRHDKEIREYIISERGMSIRGQFQGVNGILAGTPTHSIVGEKDRIASMFSEPGAV